MPPGGNTSFEVYFLGNGFGRMDGLVFITTNKGVVKYKVGLPIPISRFINIQEDSKCILDYIRM